MATTKLTPSVYDAEAALLDLANEYLEPDSYSTLKSGLFGYMTGSMARISAEGVHHRNVFYRENFLNTASMPRSIYSYAKIYNYNIGMAKPSQARILFGAYLDDLKSTLGSETGVITLSRYQPVFLGNTPFMIAGSVRLAILEGNRVSAEYDLNEMNFTLPNQGEYVRTYVTPQVVDTDGTTRTVVYMELHVYQVSARATEFQVITTNALETSFYRVPLVNNEQLASFRIMYKKANEPTFKEIPGIFNESQSPTTSEYAYYTFSSNNELEIFFSPMPGSFRPAYNSKLRIEFLTTTGIAGNFDFTGTPSASIIGNTIPVLVEMVTSPAGGYNGETLLEVKRGVMRKILERNNITIESDLENYLTGAIDRTKVHNSSLKFIKRRDDIQKRLFAAFLLLKDSSGRVVPTNTANLDFEAADLEARGWSIRPGTLVIYDPQNKLFRLVESGEYPDRMANDPNSFVYSVPFLLQFRTQPFPHLVYYQNQVELDAPLQSLPGDAIASDSFIANSITVRRNSVFESTYQFDFAVSSNLDAEGIAAKCLVRIAFFDESNVNRGYVEAVHVTGTNIFRAILNTDDAFDGATNEMLFTSSLWNEVNNTLMPAAPLPQKLRAKIELYYDNQSNDTSVRYVQRGSSIYQLASLFQTTDLISLYRSLDRVMFSDMYVSSEGTFHCRNVPLIGSNFFLNPRIGQEAVTTISQYYNAILEVFDLLHNNTSVDIKLYNSYGPSHEFNVDRPNISLKLEVRSKGRASEELRNKVIYETSAFVQSCNDNDRSRFSISNLTTHLENIIPDIAFIRFIGLNGVAIQNSEHIYGDTLLDRDNKRIPEYLNVTTILRSSLDKDPYVPDVTVNFI